MLKIIKTILQVYTWVSYPKKSLFSVKEIIFSVFFFLILIAQVKYISTLFLKKDNFIKAAVQFSIKS